MVSTDNIIQFNNPFVCMTGPRGPAGPPGGGVSYTRWGRTTCPTTEGTQLVYEGATVGVTINKQEVQNFCVSTTNQSFFKSHLDSNNIVQNCMGQNTKDMVVFLLSLTYSVTMLPVLYATHHLAAPRSQYLGE